MSTAEDILQQALDLPEQERVEIAHNLFRSVRHSAEEVGAAWVKTAAARLKAYKRGELESQPMDEAVASSERGCWRDVVELLAPAKTELDEAAIFYG